MRQLRHLMQPYVDSPDNWPELFSSCGGICKFLMKGLLHNASILVTIKFHSLSYLIKWFLEWERLAFLKRLSRLTISLLISLLIQGVEDLIGTLLWGMHWFMMDLKDCDHFFQKKTYFELWIWASHTINWQQTAKHNHWRIYCKQQMKGLQYSLVLVKLSVFSVHQNYHLFWGFLKAVLCFLVASANPKSKAWTRPY